MDIDWAGSAGVFLTRHALAQGHDDKTISRMVRIGEWHRIRRGAFVAGAIWRAMDEIGRHRLTARAVLLTAHPTATLSHASSILEHEAPVWGVPLDEIHLTRTDGRPGRREAGVVHHHGHLDESDVRTINGIRATPPARAVIELSTMATVESCLVSANSLLAAGATTRAELESSLSVMTRWPGTLRSDLVVRLADPRCAWAGEARTSHLLWREHLPAPIPQYEVFDETGHLVAILDFAWPDRQAFCEFDGKIKYERLRRPGESLEDVILREKRRQEIVTLLTGWVCIRITWRDLERPAVTARRIRALLGA